jgi:hypothetical protein
VRVVLVPTRSNGGAEPVSSKTLVDLYVSEGLAQYPATKFDITVNDEALDTGVGMTLNGGGWEEVLDSVSAYRTQQKPPINVHYYGLVRPTNSFSGGVAGLAGGSGRRGSSGIGIAYPGLEKASAGTFVHELGHMHSLPHSPGCGAAGADPDYPKSTGKLDVWGWDSRKNTLINPDKTFDFLTYCDPTWVSAYVYKELAAPVGAIEKARYIIPGPMVKYSSIIIDPLGNPRWGTVFEADTPPDGEPEQVQALDASGAVLASITGYRVIMHDTGSSFVRVPNVHAAWASLRIAGAKPIAVARKP